MKLFLNFQEERKKKEFVSTRPVGFAAGKNGFLDSKWFNLIIPESSSPYVIHFCGLLKAALLLCMQEMDMLHVVGNKVEISFAKIGFVDSKFPTLITRGS